MSEFVRTPLVPQACPDCDRPVFIVKDEAGTVHCLDASQSVFVQIRDWDPGEPVVMPVTAYVEHAALCRATRKAAA